MKCGTPSNRRFKSIMNASAVLAFRGPQRYETRNFVSGSRAVQVHKSPKPFRFSSRARFAFAPTYVQTSSS